MKWDLARDTVTEKEKIWNKRKQKFDSFSKFPGVIILSSDEKHHGAESISWSSQLYYRMIYEKKGRQYDRMSWNSQQKKEGEKLWPLMSSNFDQELLLFSSQIPSIRNFGLIMRYYVNDALTLFTLFPSLSLPFSSTHTYIHTHTHTHTLNHRKQHTVLY